MMVRRLLSSTAPAAFAAALFAAPAMAEVTSDEVWQEMRDLVAFAGQTITADSPEQDGDTLVVNNVVVAYAKDGTTATSQIGTIRLRDTGDGTVEVTLPDSYPLDVTVSPPETADTPVTAKLLVSQPGLVVTVSGDDAERSYDLTAPKFTVALQEVTGGNAPTDLKVQAELSGVTGSYIVAPKGDQSRVNSSFAADALMVDAAGTLPETPPAEGEAPSGPGSMTLRLSMADLSGTSNSVMLPAADMVDMATALAKGFSSDGSFSSGATAFDMTVTDADGATAISTKGDSASFGFGLNAQTISYTADGKGVALQMTTPTLPFPVNLTYAEAAFNVLMPVGPTDGPADFAFLAKLVDLSISDEVWAMFDPTAQLPRDPATVIIDATGTAKLNASIMNPTDLEKMATPPGDLYSLNLRQLLARFAGAELTGEGAFTFDNNDLSGYGGMPAPTGKIDLKLVGGNALMDKLVAMGLLPEDQVMGFRMMLSMFANATGEDELSSTLEFKDGGFFANGQQLQ